LSLQIQAHTVGGDRLVDDYLRQDGAIAEFFVGSPFEAETFHGKAREVRGRFDASRLEDMARAVRPLSEAGSVRLADIAEGHGYFVTTGQQPGLFGGPLYTVHKAATAIALARRLEQVLGAPVMPLFWVASDDHDWDEANHVHLLDTANVLRRITLSGEAAPLRSMGRRHLGIAVETALDELSEALPPSDFTPSIITRLREVYQADATVASAFAGTLATLFAGTELGLVDGQDPLIRRLGQEVLRRDLEAAAGGESALADQTKRLEAVGYGVQVPVLDGASNVFHEDETHGRERLIREDGRWVLRGSNRRLGDVELAALLTEEPDRFSANVVLRPVVESYVFPTLAYVAGPGEIRYLAQTRRLFEARGVGMPVVFPRMSVTLIESKVAKVLGRFGLEVESFHRPVHEVIAAVVREDVPPGVKEALSALRGALQSGYGALNEAAKEVDVTLKGPISGARNDALRALGELEKKILQHMKLKQETELEQIEKAAVNLSPQGKPQERVLNVHQYLARYGPELIGRVLAEVATSLDSRVAVVAGRNRAVL
jgi:bacillithiol synthase